MLSLSCDQSMLQAACTLHGQGTAYRLSLHGMMGGNGGNCGLYGMSRGPGCVNACGVGNGLWAYVRQLAASVIMRLMGGLCFMFSVCHGSWIPSMNN
jgi:hypothetical protein